MINVLVIGGKGFIGSSIVKKLNAVGYRCLIGTKRIDKLFLAEQILINPFYSIDLGKNKIDLVINASGYYTRENSMHERDKLISANLGVVNSIIKTRQLNGIPLITFGSYFEKSPLNSEFHSLNYTKIKLAAKECLLNLQNKTIQNITYIYLYDTYGYNDKRGKVLDYIINKIKIGSNPTIMNPKSIINLTNSIDIANCVYIMSQNVLSGKQAGLIDYQIRSKNEFYLIDLVEVVKNIYSTKNFQINNLNKLNKLWNCAKNIPELLVAESIEKFIFEKLFSKEYLTRDFSQN